jgi:hypothetical protein
MFTQYDIDLLTKIVNDFPAFLYALEFDEPIDTIKALLSDDKMIEIPRRDVDIVEAWVSWNLTMKCDQAIMWQADLYSDAVMRRARVLNITTPLGPIHPKIAIRSRCLEYTENGSRGFFFKAWENAGRGLSIHHLIIEGVKPDSVLWQRIVDYTAPCLFSCNEHGKLITIV